MCKGTDPTKLAYWTDIIRKCKDSGMNTSEWCRMNQISRDKYYYWHDKIMRGTYTLAVENSCIPDTNLVNTDNKPSVDPVFTELSEPSVELVSENSKLSGVSMKWNDFTITIDPDFSEKELLKVLRVIHHV